MTYGSEQDSERRGPTQGQRDAMDNAAESAVYLYRAYINAGFNGGQAFELTKTALRDTLDA
jgi:hypothetical protein